MTPSSASAEASATTAMTSASSTRASPRGIERQLRIFVARRHAVAAKQRHQSGARVRRDGQLRLAHLIVDELAERRAVIDIAGQRRGGF